MAVQPVLSPLSSAEPEPEGHPETRAETPAEIPGETPTEALHRVFGFSGFRPGQAEVLEAMLAGRDTLAVMPTGAGKSVLLALMALQFRRYPGAQVFAFDFGGSIRAAILAMGGDWHDLGGELTDEADTDLKRLDHDLRDGRVGIDRTAGAQDRSHPFRTGIEHVIGNPYFESCDLRHTSPLQVRATTLSHPARSSPTFDSLIEIESSTPWRVRCLGSVSTRHPSSG